MALPSAQGKWFAGRLSDTPDLGPLVSLPTVTLLPSQARTPWGTVYVRDALHETEPGDLCRQGRVGRILSIPIYGCLVGDGFGQSLQRIGIIRLHL